MQKKYFTFQPKGMNTELSPKIHSNGYATYMKNIRLTNEDNGTLSIQFERGTKKYDIGNTIKGYVLGNCVFNDYVILFTYSPNSITGDDGEIINSHIDYIYKLEFNIDRDGEEIPIITELFKGNLNFDKFHNISTLGIYENDNIQKVYWIDGLNPIRVINVMGDYSYYKNNLNDTIKNSAFDFVPVLNLKEKINIKKDVSYGNFPQGTIQYVFSYYNKNGRQSNLFAQSELQYLSYAKGVSSEEKVHCNFNITITNIDKQFDYLRIYSIIRTTKDSTPTCKRVVDIELKTVKDEIVSFIDDNTTGDIIDETELLYLGGYNLCPNVFEQKDNTLFLANYTVQNNDFTQTQINDIRDHLIPLINSNGDSSIKLKFIENTDENQQIKIKGDSYYSYEGELMNSNISVFKYLEWYGFAIQFQNINGRFSTPIYLGSVQNLIPNKLIDNETINPAIISMSFNKNTINELKNCVDTNIWIRCRLLMVNPTESLRTIKCQGIVSSTVFNYYDRYNNSPYGMSSWRMIPIDNHLKPLAGNESNDCEIQNIVANNQGIMSIKKIVDLTNTLYYNVYLEIQPINIFSSRDTNIKVYKVKNGVQDSHPIGERNWGHSININPTGEDIKNYAEELAEVIRQDIFAENNIPNITRQMCTFEFNQDFFSNTESSNKTTKTIYLNTSENNFSKNQFAIDESIITFNSPDIEEQSNNINDSCKLRIIGLLGEKDKFSNYLFQSEGQRDSTSIGMINKKVNDFKNIIGWQDVDYTWDGKSNTKDIHRHNFVTYLWNRTTTFADIGQDLKGENEYTVASKVKQKIISNTRICNTIYLQDLLDYDENIDETNKFRYKELKPSKIQTITTNKDSLYVLGKESLSNNNKLLNSDVNKIFPSFDEYPIKVSQGLNNIDTSTYIDLIIGENTLKVQDPIQIRYKETPSLLIDISNMQIPQYASEYQNYLYTTLPSLYPITKDTDYLGFSKWSTNANPIWINCNTTDIKDNYGIYQRENLFSEYVIKYSDNIIGANRVSKATDIKSKYNATKTYFQQFIRVDKLYEYNNYYYLVDIVSKEENPYEQYTYTDDHRLVYNKDIVSQYSFIPISDTVQCIDNNVDITSHTGDTYYQRWDCLKTFPYSTDDKQQYIDITSFFIESRINLDGRYDKQRGLNYNLGVTNENFNLINNNYTQQNNYFNYRDIYIDEIHNFPNQLTYSKTKTLGEDIDTWTNQTLASVFDFDGLKGDITELKVFNNNIYCFQDTGIARLLFNSRVQINTSDGVPIEIANNAKLDDVVYISDTIGCSKKESISKSSNGIYFIDNKNKALYRLNDQGIQPISEGKFNKFFKERDVDVNYITFFDMNTMDLYIYIPTMYCVAFNEKLNEFTSFYSYTINNKACLFNLKDKTLQLVENVTEDYSSFVSNLYEYYKGEYGNFYDNDKNIIGSINGISTEIEFIANPEFDGDKIFDVVEFNDNNIYAIERNKTIVQSKTTFDYLTVSNEYQKSTVGVSALKKKFRTWRWQIGRDMLNTGKRDRIRNEWAKIKLEKYNYKENRKIYGINIAYYI